MKALMLIAAASALAVTIMNTQPAHAQATRTWVSGVGDDVNPCSRTAPCKTFAGAISKTAAGGVINCLDPGGFGAVTITKSITIDCQGTFAGVLAASTNGIIVNGAGIIVTLRNLAIEGANGTGLIGVSFLNGAVLHIENCNIFGFRSGSARGISFTPPSGVSARLHVRDSVINDNGIGQTGGGIVFSPVGAATFLISRTQLASNAFGVALLGAGSAGIRGTVRDSVITGSINDGLIATTTGSVVNLFVDNSGVNHNAVNGVRSDGGSSLVILNRSTVMGNATGVVVTNGGLMSSYRNNFINGNIVADGIPQIELRQN